MSAVRQLSSDPRPRPLVKGKWTHQLDLLRSGNRESVEHWTSISNCAKAKEWRLALNLLSDVHLAVLEPSIIKRTLAIEAFQKAEEWSKALDLLLNMEENMQEDVHDLISYNILLSQSPTWITSLSLLRRFQSLLPGLRLSTVSFNAVARSWSRTSWLLEELKQRNLKATAVSYLDVVFFFVCFFDVLLGLQMLFWVICFLKIELGVECGETKCWVVYLIF